MLFSQNGTLVGLPITITVLGSLGPVAQYVEIHNLSQANTFSCVSNNVTFIIPPMRKLVLTEGTQQITLTGTGDYIVLANSASQGNAAGPSLEPTLYGTGGLVSVSPADGVTIEDTGTVIRVKDGGISSAKLAPLAVTTDKVNLLAIGTAQLADSAVDSNKLANLAVNNAKLADLAVNFNKTGSGINQNPGRGASAIFNYTAIPTAAGDTLTVTFNGAPVVYLFQIGGLPAAAGAQVGVDLATINVDLPAKVSANQPLVSCASSGAAVWFGIAVQSLIQAGATLALVSSTPGAEENYPATSESRVGLEFHSFTATALNTSTGFPIYTSGTLVAAWGVETDPTGIQVGSAGVRLQPLVTGDGVVAVGSGVVGNVLNVILAVAY